MNLQQYLNGLPPNPEMAAKVEAENEEKRKRGSRGPGKLHREFEAMARTQDKDRKARRMG